ncbi:MAG: chromate efflux transporter [Cytophagales bacterium]
MSKFEKYRILFFLRDVLYLAFFSIGGPNAHLGYFINLLVEKRKYITEIEFLELNALCQILPGPTSTQVIVAVGYKMGKATLAYLTLLVWCLPAVTCMIVAAYFIAHLPNLNFAEFVFPLAVALVLRSCFKLATKSITTKTSVLILIFTCGIAFFFKNSYIYPLLIIAGGLVASIKWKRYKIESENPDKNFKVPWANFILFVSVYVVTLFLGGVTDWLPLKLFQNFYRIGSVIFGGGNVLVPLFYTEFVEMKSYLTRQEFISGYAFSQMVPGPVFSLASFLGALSLRDWGLLGFIFGGIIAAAGIFLPGTFLIFFLVKIWENLKSFPIIKAAMEGVVAVSTGLLAATGFTLFFLMQASFLNYGIFLVSLLLLFFTKVNPSIWVLIALTAGLIF